MATIAEFQIIDYDGSLHNYYRFADAYPNNTAGVFANFPLGNHDFMLETYVRRLRLEASEGNYWVDLTYVLNLSDRTIKISSNYEELEFEGSFEEAVRHFCYEDYSEKEALSYFAKKEDVFPILIPGFLKGMRSLIDTLPQEVSYLEPDAFGPEILYIGDNINFYMYKDFICYPRCDMNVNPKAMDDAFFNARRVGVRLYFKNAVSGRDFSLLYMLGVRAEGYLLPLTKKFVRYGETLDEETKMEELEILVEYLNKHHDSYKRRALNVMPGISYGEEMEEIRKSVRERHIGKASDGR